MLIPKAFALTDAKEQQTIVDTYPFATVLNTINNDGEVTVDAQHLPLYWYTDNNSKHFLHGHIARANPIWQQSLVSSQTLCIFNGPQAYITPNWYPTKKQHGKAVPTWNYVVVHIRGTIEFIHDDDWKREMLVVLTDAMEHDIEKDQENPWQLSDAPADYIQKMLQAIVGIKIAIESIEGQCKLSQNQPKENYENIIIGLKQSQQTAASTMAGLMQQTRHL